jgi:gliding motility-associated-like protein
MAPLLFGWMLATALPARAAPSVEIGIRTYILYPPNAVTDLTASQVGAQSGDAQLVWTAPRNINGARIDHYLIRYATYPAPSTAQAENWWDSQGANEVTISPAHAPGIPEFPILHNLTLGVTIYFGVKAVDVDNQIAPIDLRVGTTNQAKCTPLNVGSNAPPDTPDNFAGTALSSTSLRWSWDSARDASFYMLSAYPSGTLINTTTGLYLIETNLTPNAPISRTVRGGNGSGFSNPTVAETVYTLANTPTLVTISHVGFTTITLSWNAASNPTNTQYRLEQSNDGLNFSVVTLVSSLTVVDTGLSELTTYYYRLRALNGDGLITSPSIIVSTMTPNQLDFIAPNEPSGLKGNLDGSGRVFTLSWESVTTNVDGTPTTDLAGYDIYRRTALTGAPIKVTPVPLTVTAFADQVNNQVYYYTVRAIDASGNTSIHSLLADSSSESNIIFLGADEISSVVMPQAVNDLLRSNFNKYGVPLTIQMDEEAIPVGTQIVRQVRLTLVRVDNKQKLNDLAFARPQAIVSIGYALTNGNVGQGSPTAQSAPAASSVTPDQLSIYWNNGVSWVKIGGTLDLAAQALKTKSSFLGVYQLRSVGRASSLSLPQANVFPRVFTPNGDGLNDHVFFVLENPNGAQIVAEIFDFAGRRVATLPPPTASSSIGDAMFKWDGKDFNGGRVPSGAYYYTIQGEGKSFTGTVVVAR